MKKICTLLILSTGLLLKPCQAVELPATLAPLHHWDAYDPHGTGIQPADGSVISNLVDRISGNDAILVAGGPTYQFGDPSTIGGQPSIRFTTADGLRSINAITDQSVTIFSVSKLNGGANRRLITGTNPSNYLLGYWGNFEDRAHNGTFFGANATATTNRHMYIHQALNDGSDILQDADVVIPNDLGAGAAISIGQLGFGGINWNAGESSNGDISEIIIFDSDMTPAELDEVGRYLSEKYGFTAFGHDGSILGGGPTGPAPFTWTNGNGNGLWNEGGNWFGGVVPGVNDLAIFDGSVPGTLVDLGGGQSVGGITFRSTADAIQLVNGPLTVDRLTQASRGTNTVTAIFTQLPELQTIAGELDLAGDLDLVQPTTANVKGGVLRVSGILGGNASLTKTGPAPLALSNSGNTFTGSIDIEQGRVRVDVDGALGATSGTTTVHRAGTLEFSGNLSYDAAEPIELQGTLLGSNGTPTLGANVNLMPGKGATLASTQGSRLIVAADFGMSRVTVSGEGEVELAGTLSSPPTSFGLNQLEAFSTGNQSITADGYTFDAYIDHDDFQGWLLVGRGRDGWEFDTDGQDPLESLERRFTRAGIVLATDPNTDSDLVLTNVMTTIDAQNVAVGQLVILKDQVSSPEENGLYIVGADLKLTRDVFMNETEEIAGTTVDTDPTTGSVNTGLTFHIDYFHAGTIDVDPISWVAGNPPPPPPVGPVPDVPANLGTPAAFEPAAYSEAVINDLMAQAGLELHEVEIRIKRAMDPDGSEYHEARWQAINRADWTWDFNINNAGIGARHRILGDASSPFLWLDSQTRDTAATVNGFERIFTWPWGGHNFVRGFSFGAAVADGADHTTSFLWEFGNENHAMPYTEIYIRGTQSDGLYKTGSGTLILSGSNAYALETIINEGVVEVRADGALGDSTGGTMVNEGGTLKLGGDIAYVTLEPVILSARGKGGILGNADGTNQIDAPVSISLLEATSGTFTGADPGEGLDLDGNFLYAVNASGPGGLQVRDALFSNEAGVSNLVTILAQRDELNWQTPNFGESPDDNNLELVMQSIRWTPNPRSVQAKLGGLTIGAPYKLQLLFYEPTIVRAMDLHLDAFIEPTRLVDDFTPGSTDLLGRVITLEFTASATAHTVILNGVDTPFANHDPFLQAFTLEQTVTNIGLAGRARVEAESGLLTLNGSVDPGNSVLELGGASTVWIPSSLTGGPDGGLHKVDAGDAVLSGDNTGLQGDITVEGGRLILASDTAWGDGGETRVNPGGTLALQGDITLENENLVLSGPLALLNLSGNNTFGASVALSSGSLADIGIASDAGSLTINANLDLVYSRFLVDGAGDIVINGSINSSAPTGGLRFEDVVTAAGPIAYYTFDNLVDADTLANDGSMTNTAEVLGTATLAPARHGNGLAIGDGSNGIVEVNLPGTLTQNPIPLPASGNYTVGGWFNDLHDTNNWRTFVRSFGGANDHQIIIETGSLRLGMYQGGFHYSGYDVDGSAGAAIDVQTGWHMIVAVGRSNNTTEFYIDNVLVGTSPRTSRSNIWRIGAWPGQTFADLVDDVFVYDRSLELPEIQTLWDARDGLIPSNELVKMGSGSLSLNADNNYRDGTSVLGGSLLVNNQGPGSGTGSGQVSVGNGGILGGDGNIFGPVEINAGGSLAPGSQLGELDISMGINFNATNTIFTVEIFGDEENPLEYDQVNTSGDLNLSGKLILLRDAGYSPSSGDELFIATAQGNLQGTFNDLNEGASVSDNQGGTYTISYQGNSVTLTADGGFDITSITQAPGPGANEISLTFRWASKSGLSYLIESASAPEGPWTPLASGIAGQVDATSHTEVLGNFSGLHRLYFRVGEE